MSAWVAVLLAAITWSEVGRLRGDVLAVRDAWLYHEHAEIDMQTLVTEWRIADGSTMRVTTPREADESTADWIARHREAVDAAKAEFPPA